MHDLTSLAGVGLRHKHYQDVLDDDQNDIGWFEVHPENFFGSGGPSIYYLSKIRQEYPISFHGVGLSLGSPDRPDRLHLEKLKTLIERFDPFVFSDHASWSSSGNAHLNDLLPLPYTKETLATLCRNVEITQEYLGREILIENPSTYIKFKHDEFTEPEVLNALVDKTGCKLLLDVNNIFVQSYNHKFNPFEYIDAINSDAVREIHLAGHTHRKTDNIDILIDTHNNFVRPEVWDLYEYTIKQTGDCMTLIEWDQDFPTFNELCGEAYKARDIMAKVKTNAAA